MICSAVQLHSLEGPTLDTAAVRWERRGGASADGITANVHTTLYAVHKGRIKVCWSQGCKLCATVRHIHRSLVSAKT